MNEYNGPQVWDKLLKVVRETAYPSAVIAGGCVRDWFHDESIVPHDIDIFVGVRDEFEFDIAFHGLPFIEKRQLTAETSGYTKADVNEFASNILGGVIEAYTDTMGHKINIVGKRVEAIEDVPGGLLTDFDHSLCEFWWDGEKVCRTASAYASFVSKRIEINPHAASKARTQQRLRSLVRRQAYKDYKFDGQAATSYSSSLMTFKKLAEINRGLPIMNWDVLNNEWRIVQ